MLAAGDISKSTNLIRRDSPSGDIVFGDSSPPPVSSSPTLPPRLLAYRARRHPYLALLLWGGWEAPAFCLDRLKKVYVIAQTPMRGYMARCDRYDNFFHDHFAWLASVAVYIVTLCEAVSCH